MVRSYHHPKMGRKIAKTPFSRLIQRFWHQRRTLTSPILYLTIIPLALVGYEMIDSQRGTWRRVGYNHLISNKREWNNCFIKNNQEILLDHANFALQEQAEDNLMVAFS